MANRTTDELLFDMRKVRQAFAIQNPPSAVYFFEVFDCAIATIEMAQMWTKRAPVYSAVHEALLSMRAETRTTEVYLGHAELEVDILMHEGAKMSKAEFDKTCIKAAAILLLAAEKKS